ncbi:MAG: hypothetical protein WCO11_12895 [Sphingomonadales bacterium]
MRRPDHRRAARLARSVSPLAMAAMLALQPQPLRAQAFQGTATVILGNVDRFSSGSSDLFFVNAPQNSINWRPNDQQIGQNTPINFLPQGSSATFVGSQLLNGARYTVLNRIIADDPARAIMLAGTVKGDAAGSIWFYAPGGLLLTGTARFDVGSLLLTANDPVGAAGGKPYIDDKGHFQLQAALGSKAAITIAKGAQISAANPGSYVIAVAPRFDMAGTISANGSAALAAVGDASVTLNGGLFDITANVGSDAGGTSSVTGSITGPAGNAAQGQFHRIYLMAVPRNDAMTLLITGGAQLGFDIAGAADVDGNTVVLSGGYDIKAAQFTPNLNQFGDAPAAGSVGQATIAIDAATVTSKLLVRSKDGARAFAETGDLSFVGDLDVFADRSVSIGAAAGRTLAATSGGIRADASPQGLFGTGADRTAGTASISVLNGGTVTAKGAIQVLAVGAGDSALADGQAGSSGRGGTAIVSVLGGALSGTNLVVDASGVAGIAPSGAGGSGVAGSAQLQADAGAVLGVQSISVTARAVGGLGAAGFVSGNARGGAATVALDGTNLSLPGDISVVADAGFGGGGRLQQAHLGGGEAAAGTATMSLQPGTQVRAATLTITADSASYGAAGSLAARAGDALLTLNDSAATTLLQIGSGITLSASAFGTPGLDGGNTAAGSATGGFARLITTGNPFINVLENGLSVLATAVGGSGKAGVGGDALGGRAHFDMQGGGTALLPGLTLDASARAGNGSAGGTANAFDAGDAQPPAVFLRYGAGAAPQDSGIRIGAAATLTASAVGGTGAAGAGGAASGGLVSVVVNSGAISAGGMDLSAAAQGGAGSVGGAARSGRVFQRLSDGDLILKGDSNITLNAGGGAAVAGSGGTGGSASVGDMVLRVTSGDTGPGALFSAGSMRVNARATGGAGGSGITGGGAGGAAFGVAPGGTANGVVISVEPAQSAVAVGALQIDASAAGGVGGDGLQGSAGGSGGAASGGFASVGIASGPGTPANSLSSVSFGTLAVFVPAQGGAGGGSEATAGRGGDAVGGTATLLARGGAVAAVSVQIAADAQGGDAGTSPVGDAGAGTGIGGSANILVTPHYSAGFAGSLAVDAGVTLTAAGRGGASALRGGAGTGGTASIALQRHEAAGAAAAASAGTLSIGGVVALDARGSGGQGLANAAGGDGTGGTTRIFTQAGTSLLQGDVLMTASGEGGIGANGLAAGNGRGGNAGIGLDGGALTLAGSLSATVRGQFGAARGGTAIISTTAAGGSLLFNGPDLLVDASAGSGDGFEFGPGANTRGGSITVTSGTGSRLQLRPLGRDGTMFLTAAAEVRNLTQFTAGDAAGGSIVITANGLLELNGGTTADLVLTSAARGGAGGSLLAGGAATGGSVSLAAASGGTLRVDSAGRLFTADASSFGGTSDVKGGNAGAGVISLAADDGTVRITGDTVLAMDAGAGGGAPGGLAGGSSTRLRFDNGGTLAFEGPLTVNGRANGLGATGGAFAIQSSSGGSLSVAGNLDLMLTAGYGSGDNRTITGGQVQISTVSSSSLAIGGRLFANLAVTAEGAGLNSQLTGGSFLWNHGGSGRVTGTVDVLASAAYPNGTPGIASGGTAAITAQSGLLMLGATDIDVTAVGGNSRTAAGSAGRGGSAALSTLAGGSLRIGGRLTLDASARGGNGLGTAGGSGQGGNVTLANAGTLDLLLTDGELRLLAAAAGGDSVGRLAPAGRGGDAVGGTITVSNAAAAGLTITAGLGTLIDAGAGGGVGAPGGAALGGNVVISNAGTLGWDGALTASAQGRGGIGGGDGTGGTVAFVQSGGAMRLTGAAALAADGLAGDSGRGIGGNVSVTIAAGDVQVKGASLAISAAAQGGNARAGGIDMTLGGRLGVDADLAVTAGADGGNFNPAADVAGGNISIAVRASGQLQTGGQLNANAGARAGQILGGAVRGGRVALTSAGTVLIGTDIGFDARAGNDGLAATAVLANGGDASVSLTAGTLGAANLTLDASAQGLDSTGNGGAATAGRAAVAVDGGQLTTGGALTLLANAVGGGARGDGAGGIGTAGTVRASVAGAGSQLNAAASSLSAVATGGAAAGAGAAGAAVGGTAEMLVSAGGSLQVNTSAVLRGSAIGGRNDGSGSSGAATAGVLRAMVDGASGGSLGLAVNGAVTVEANGDAGRSTQAGGAGALARAGQIEIGSTGNGGVVSIGDLLVSASANGGNGGGNTDGGAAVGGTVFVGMGRAARSATPGSFAAASINVLTGAHGGAAGSAGNSPGAADGGSILLAINGASGTVSGPVRLASEALVRPATQAVQATGGRIAIAARDAADGSAAGSLAINGVTSINHIIASSSAATAYTDGVTRLTATGIGSRLGFNSALAIRADATGSPVASALGCSGIVAGTGARIDLAGDAAFQSAGDFGLNDGGVIAATGSLTVTAAGRVLAGYAAPTPGATGTLLAPVVSITGTGGVDLATNSNGSTDVTLTTSGTLAARDLRAERTLQLNGASIAIGNASAGGRLAITASAAVTTGTLDSGVVAPFAGATPSVYVRGGEVTTGAVSSGRDIGLVASGNLASGSLTSGGDVVLLTGGAISTGAITTPGSGRTRFDAAAQAGLIGFNAGVPDYTNLFAAAPATLAGDIGVAGGITTGLIDARTTGTIRITGTINASQGARLAAGTLRLGGINTPGFLDLAAATDVLLGDLNVTGALTVTTNGSISTGAITSGQSLTLTTTRPGTTLATGAVRAAGDIRLSAAAGLSTGTLSAGNRVFLNGGSAISAGAIDAGIVNPQQGGTGLLFASTPGTISAGTVRVAGSATLAGALGVAAGAISAPGGIVLLDAGGITTGALATNNTGFVYIAAHDLLPQISFDQAGNPQFAALLAATPVRLAGIIGISGPVSTGRFMAAAIGNVSAQSISAPASVLIDAGGLVTLAGNVSASGIAITSGDIAVAPGLSIGGDAAQSITLRADSTASAAVIGGDGVVQTGTYSLSNAEFGALRASSITVNSGKASMLVQALALPAVAPGQIANPGVTLQTDSILRVTGAVTMPQAGASNRLSLMAGTRIELVQGSGSIRLGGVDTPAATLSLQAPRVWVGTDSLIGQLAGGQLTGTARDTALNSAGPAAVAGGSLGAGTILVSVGNELLVQNSGNAVQRAGFTAGSGGLRISRLGDTATPIDVVINGRSQRADGSFAANEATLPQVAFVPGAGILTANSAVNACLVVGGCPVQQPVLTIINTVEALTIEEEVRRETARAAAEKLPIVLLQRLIDFSPLFSDPDATDPVTSGGNPALWREPAPAGTRAPGGVK